VRSSSSRQSWRISRLAMAEVLADDERHRIGLRDGLQHCRRSVHVYPPVWIWPSKKPSSGYRRPVSVLRPCSDFVSHLFSFFLSYSIPHSILTLVSFLPFDIFFLVVENTSSSPPAPLVYSAPPTCVFFAVPSIRLLPLPRHAEYFFVLFHWNCSEVNDITGWLNTTYSSL